MQERFMRRALELARCGLGRVSPNPLVGAVVVRGDEIVGEGYHLFSRKDHAEIVALAVAGDAARGADLYVNLEPCHYQGRTSPCTRAVLEAGIRRVFAAVHDPNPRVAGAGIRFLQEAGIETRVGCLETEATRLNEHFVHYIQTSRPFVLLKLAQTLDGKIAGAKGEARWITSAAAREYSQQLRFEYDAILIGGKTLLLDDPSLNVRWNQGNSIIKVILDSHLNTPHDARIFESGDLVLIFHHESVSILQKEALSVKAELVPVPSGRRGLDVGAVLDHLGKRMITSLIVEGGSRVAASFLEAKAVQRVNLFYAPKILGDLGISGVGPFGRGALDRALELEELSVRSYPPDILVEARVKY